MENYIFTENDWNIFVQICIFFKPFKEVTTIMLGSTYPTFLMTVPRYNSFVNYIEDIITMGDSEQIIYDAAKEYKTKLLEYYNKINNVCLIATVLDPRLKLRYYRDNNWDDDLISNIQQV